MLRLFLLAGLLLPFAAVRPVYSQDVEPAAPDTASAGPRVYLDCDACDFTYIRRQIPYVQYVRDPQLAQLHVLVTSRRTGGGGRTYRLAYIGRQDVAGRDFELTYTADQTATDDDRRRGLTRTLRLGLMPYLAETPLAERVAIDVAGVSADALQQPDDPWNLWVFSISLGGAFETEESQNEASVYGGLRAERTTTLWKLILDADGWYERERFDDEDGAIRSTSHDADFTSRVVRSLSPHWSAALLGEVTSSTFLNVDVGADVAPAIEYNIFPWAVSDRRELTMAYYAGVRTFRYREETIFDQTAETRLYEALRLQLEMTQPWGELEAGLEANHYFHDLGKYRLEFDVELDLRIVAGLSLTLDVRAESIHDQIYLPKGNASLEEVLLRRRQLATTYELSGRIGLRYTFGSIYNNVVNPRF